jgi:hypothetical protein
MKSIQEIENRKNTRNKDSQPDLESQLIAMMTAKMPLIQFGSMMMEIQMKSIQEIDNLKNTPNKECECVSESRSMPISADRTAETLIPSVEGQSEIEWMRSSRISKSTPRGEMSNRQE